MLNPKWEELGQKLRNQVKVAYWDTEQGAMPPLLGQIKGTPTIRAFVPRRGSSRNAKQALDYEQAREVKDLMRFAVANMPNFVEVVKGEAALHKLEQKAAEVPCWLRCGEELSSVHHVS